ncbi:MAG: NADH-quinone oxidoreductase subunit D [Bryobacterales bacterium]|nr:NADH-quinone oxidoreductase subunit D [Bryobacterales bacterium]
MSDYNAALANMPAGDAPNRRRTMTLNMGPQHPSTHGVLRVLLELDGETILKAVADIGYLHTGIEKQCETRTWNQVVPLTDRVDYLANLSNNLAYCLAAEKLLQMEIPARAQWMRVMLTELTRISSHIVWLGTHALDIGAMSMFMYCFREREQILKLFELFSGQRMMTSYFRIGGLALEPPRGWQKQIKKFLEDMPVAIDQYENLLTGNPIWNIRTKGGGFMSLEDLMDWGATGPMIRAAGLAWDIRKDAPYSSYEKFQFNVPTATESDVFARYSVRIAEMRESVKIMQQALDGMPEGPWIADVPRVTLPEREKMKTQMEALIYHFKIVTEGFSVPAGEVFVSVEAPRGELGYYAVSDGTTKPYRIHMRTPSFGNLMTLQPMLEGRLIADSIAALGSMDFVLGDTDR